ncbi:SAF domain-containing protein [Variovorax sp. YR752]|uniref:SAF domain-containing protein n=1 Tax=Variovorax sp. YR752 TaxID=1884383 RepID=UPI003137ABF5
MLQLPDRFATLRTETERTWQSPGQVNFQPTASEGGPTQFRRSLCIVRPVKAGEPLTRYDVRTIRPGYGLARKHLEQLLGWRVVKDAGAGTPLGWELVQAARVTSGQH